MTPEIWIWQPKNWGHEKFKEVCNMEIFVFYFFRCLKNKNIVTIFPLFIHKVALKDRPLFPHAFSLWLFKWSSIFLIFLCQQIWYFPGSSMSTRPSWSRTPVALSRRRQGTCTSLKWSPQTLATTPAWWRTRSRRPEFRVHPRHWCSAVTVSHGHGHTSIMCSHVTFFEFRKYTSGK